MSYEDYNSFRQNMRSQVKEAVKAHNEAARKIKMETKPGFRRGYRRKYNPTTGWQQIPRSGLGDTFFRYFTLFLVAVMLFCVVMGAPYKTYKTAVRGLYAFTETVGGVVKGTAQLVGVLFSDPDFGYSSVSGVPAIFADVPLSPEIAVYTNDVNTIVTCIIENGNGIEVKKSLRGTYNGEFIVDSTDASLIGHQIDVFWFFGYRLKDLDTGQWLGRFSVYKMNTSDYFAGK